jgi:DNA helicase IV
VSNTWWKDAKELVQEQADLLDIDTDKSILIQGPPGSGKTNLLLLRANQLYLGTRPNLHVVVFGSLLKSFIQIGGVQYKFPQEKIVTDTRLFSNVLQSVGEDIDTKGMAINVARRARADKLDKLIHEGRIGTPFEALLLDEAQDYTPQEIRVLRQLTNVLIATADAKQRIYEVEDCTDTLRNCTDVIYPLKYHFRNGLDICKLADGLLKGQPGYSPLQSHSNYKEAEYPSKVTTQPNLSLEQQAAAIAAQINDQRFAYPNELIGVLCPLNADLDTIQTELIKLGLHDIITRANSEMFDPARPVWLSTLTAAKGLEFRAVHIAGLDNLYKTRGVQKRLAFTGITRAKTALTLYWDKSIPGYLESAIRSTTPPKPVTTSNIFGNV